MQLGRTMVAAGLLLWAGAAEAQESGFRASLINDLTAIEAK